MTKIRTPVEIPPQLHLSKYAEGQTRGEDMSVRDRLTMGGVYLCNNIVSELNASVQKKHTKPTGEKDTFDRLKNLRRHQTSTLFINGGVHVPTVFSSPSINNSRLPSQEGLIKAGHAALLMNLSSVTFRRSTEFVRHVASANMYSARRHT